MARVAVVTGGIRGIGRAIAIALKNAGYKVAANYGHDDATGRQFSEETGIPVYKFDVADFNACVEGLKAIEAQLGPVEVLINNAGITRDATMHRMSFEQWNAVIQTNLASCFNMSRVVIEGMRERSFGRIVNTVAPGYVDTEMVRAVPKDVLEKIVARIPVGRLGKAEDISRTVLFLVADDADFITGSTLSVNGGQHMY